MIDHLQKALPFLPGYQFQIGKGKVNERKSHAFDYCNQFPIFNAKASGIGGAKLLGQENNTNTSASVYNTVNSSKEVLPSWVAFDRKVLRFYGYFHEEVLDRREEKYRIRRVNVYFYLEDDSIHVSEPKIADSGIPQGTLIRRHRIPKPESLIGQHFTISDFNVGQDIVLYSRMIKLIGCDNFTREFLSKLGLNVPENSGCPADPYMTQRKIMFSNMKATRPAVANLSLKQFLEKDRSVLRFYCVWDDRTSVFGDLRNMVVHYYLSDDTLEIKETIRPNSGRATCAMFLKRSKIARKPQFNNLSTSEVKMEYYNPSDLMIGSVIHFYGRPFLICDCDEFTRNYLGTTYGITSFEPITVKDDDESELKPFFQEPIKNIDSYSTSQIGAESQEKRHTKLAYDGIILRFLAQLKSTNVVDRDRKFVISYHFANDTISIFEPRAKNSGVIGGKFLENRRIKKHKSDQYFSSEDFYMNAELLFYQHCFVIIGADEYAKKFMADHPSYFPNQLKI